jgi:hypothetical protein
LLCLHFKILAGYSNALSSEILITATYMSKIKPNCAENNECRKE